MQPLVGSPLGGLFFFSRIFRWHTLDHPEGVLLNEVQREINWQWLSSHERTSGDGRWYVGGSVVGAALRDHAERCESLRRQDLDPLR